MLGAILFEELRADEADTLIRGAELHAPRLLADELTHVAEKKCRSYPTQREAFEEALEEALAMDIRWMEVDHPAVLRLALETGLTTYDASYLYLARLLSLPLVTFDKTLSTAARDRGG